jgi:hypothetical protein
MTFTKRVVVIMLMILSVAAIAVATDFIAMRMRTNAIYETYRGLEAAAASTPVAFEARPDRIVVTPQGAVNLVFEPSHLAWMTRLQPSVAEYETYTITIRPAVPATAKPRIELSHGSD